VLEISVVLITRNAARTLGPTLDSLTGLAAEIIAVDSCSADGTVEICQAHGARVIQRDWEGFGPQKNFAISQAGCPWVLSLDADEVLSPELAREIAALTDSTPYAAFRLRRLNHYFGSPLRHGGQYPDWQLRLFRRGSGQFSDRPVHESLQVTGRVGTLRGDILHYSYLTLDDYFDKFDRYTALEAERLLAAGTRFSAAGAANQMLVRPAVKFLRRYFLKGGFRDGVPGLLAALFNSMTMSVSYARFWEKSRSHPAGPQ